MAGFVAILARGPCEDVDAALALADALAKRHNVFLQLVDARAVYNARHLESAYQHAERATREGRATAKSLGAEFLMYLAGERQVHKAIERAGLRKGAPHIVVCAAGDRAGTAIWGVLDKCAWSRDPTGVPINPGALQALGFRTPPGAEPEDTVLQRVALVDLQK